MKKTAALILSGFLCTGLCACGTSSGPVKEDSTVITSKEDIVAVNGGQLQTIFQEAGYSLHDVEMDGTECDFEATNDNGTVDVHYELFASSHAARNEYEENVADDTEDGFDPMSRETDGNDEMTVLFDGFNNRTRIHILDDDAKTVLSCTNLSDADAKPVEKLLVENGFFKN